MYFSFKIIALLLSVILKNGLSVLYEGDSCVISSSGKNGICKIINQCPSAIRAIELGQESPQICGFSSNTPIACCADEADRRVDVGSRNENEQLQVGDKSKQKCKEYQKLIYEDPGIIHVPHAPPPPPIPVCAVVQVENIVGGTPAKDHEFPHMALINFDDDGTMKPGCGGSLISEKYVLSAAHCAFTAQFGEPKYIQLGELVLDSVTDDKALQTILIKRIIVHDDYNTSSKYNDIALFELEKEAKLSPYVRPACLNTNPSLTNKLGVASGWGAISQNGPESNKLLKVTLDMFTHTECTRTYKINRNDKTLLNGIVEETQICAGSYNESRDTCQGDSGGPLQTINKDEELFCTYNVIGVTSFGKICGAANIPGVYTRVSAYIKWIEDIVWP